MSSGVSTPPVNNTAPCGSTYSFNSGNDIRLNIDEMLITKLKWNDNQEQER